MRKKPAHSLVGTLRITMFKIVYEPYASKEVIFKRGYKLLYILMYVLLCKVIKQLFYKLVNGVWFI